VTCSPVLQIYVETQLSTFDDFNQCNIYILQFISLLHAQYLPFLYLIFMYIFSPIYIAITYPTSTFYSILMHDPNFT
jgi:hypothetical protein